MFVAAHNAQAAFDNGEKLVFIFMNVQWRTGIRSGGDFNQGELSTRIFRIR